MMLLQRNGDDTFSEMAMQPFEIDIDMTPPAVSTSAPGHVPLSPAGVRAADMADVDAPHAGCYVFFAICIALAVISMRARKRQAREMEVVTVEPLEIKAAGGGAAPQAHARASPRDRWL